MDTIRRIGLADFSTNYYWPISDIEYVGFVDDVMNSFEEIVSSADDLVLDLSVTDYRFLFFLIQHVHYSAALNTILKRKSMSIDIGPSLQALVSPNWQHHVDYLSGENLRSGHFGNPRNSVYSKVGRFLRNARDSLRVNVSGGSFDLFGLHSERVHASIGPTTSVKTSFLRRQPLTVRICEWNYYLRNFPSPAQAFLPQIQNQFLDPFLDEFSRASKVLGANPDIEQLKQCWASRMAILGGFYTAFLNSDCLPAELSISAAGNPIRKALGTASRRRGTKVFILHHGECPGVERYPHAHRNDGSMADFFICPTDRIRDNFKRNYSHSLIEQRSRIRYISSDSSHFDEMRRKYRDEPESTSDRTNTVMLIGFGMNHYRYLDGAGYFYYFQLDLQYRVALLIKRLGYTLVYKVHPDRAEEVGNLFSNIADVVEQRPFETAWQNCDSYVFTHPGSTVFGHAVFTKKPILLVDLENNNWNKDGYLKLQRRCQTVKAQYNRSNRILFDEAEFEEKLSDPMVANDDYVNWYS